MSAAPKLTGQERRAAIVQTAIKLFSEKGFRGATTRELAASVGVSEPVIYQHFATKGDLYNAIIESKSHDMEKMLADFEAFLHLDDDRAFFTHVGTLILNFHCQDPAYMRLLLFSALERHELSDLFHQRQSHSFERAVVHYIEHRVQQGAFRALDPVLIASSFFGMVAHYGMWQMLSPKCALPMDQKELIDGMVGIFLKGIQNEAM